MVGISAGSVSLLALWVSVFVVLTSDGLPVGLLADPIIPVIKTQHEKVASFEWSKWSSYSPCSRTCGVGVRHRTRHCMESSGLAKFVTTSSLCQVEDTTFELCNTKTCGSGPDDVTDRQYNRLRLGDRWRGHDKELTKEKSWVISARTDLQDENTESIDDRRGSDYTIRVQLPEMSKDEGYQTSSEGTQSFAPEFDYDNIDIRPSTLLRKWNKYDGVKTVSTQNIDMTDVRPIVVPPTPGWQSQTTDHADTEGNLTDATDSRIVEPQVDNTNTSETSQPPTNDSAEINSTEAERDVTTGVNRPTTEGGCHDNNNASVKDIPCGSSKKPEVHNSSCDNQYCKPRWLASGWGKCSVTCGEGRQLRNIHCWQTLETGFHSSVHSSLCANLVLPSSVQSCRQIDCGPLWEMSEWSQCCSTCKSRLQTRHVRCLVGDDDMKCPPRRRPISSRICAPGTSASEWRTSKWGECTGACDKGVQRRHVTCQSPTRHLLHDKNCDQGMKPISVKSCGDKSECPPVWVPQEWGLCSPSCGKGITRRHVICSRVIGGQSREVGETECKHLSKPHTFGTCTEMPCEPLWYNTEWSQCSKTCGSGGMRMRDVKCYDKNGTRSYGCSRAKRPTIVQSCPILSCQQSTVSDYDNECKDTGSPNCHLVVGFRLCGHWFYKKACCHTCRLAASRGGVVAVQVVAARRVAGDQP